MALGGGTGLSTLILALKDTFDKITAVVTSYDSGGHSGELIHLFGVLPPGDLRSCLLALAPESERKKILHTRLDGISLGNLWLMEMEKRGRLKRAHRILRVRKGHRVIRVSEERADLSIVRCNGKEYVGEHCLDDLENGDFEPITRAYLSPKPKANPEVLEAISKADLILFSMGDLFGSLLVHSLVEGIPEAISESKAKIIYLCNLLTKPTDSHGFVVEDFIREVEGYFKRKVNLVFYNTRPLTEAAQRRYAAQNSQPVSSRNGDPRFLRFDLLSLRHKVARHDPQKLLPAILSVLAK